MLSALHVACLGGIIEVIHDSLLRIIDEAIKRYIMPGAKVVCWRPHLAGTQQYYFIMYIFIVILPNPVHTMCSMEIGLTFQSNLTKYLHDK